MRFPSRNVLTFLGSTLLLGACGQTNIDQQAVQEPPPQASTEIRKSPNDTREYRYIVLPNKLRAVLISDPTTEQAAASLSVYRGSFHEPENRPGLAHFLEHMLFIQTEAYPEENGFQNFVSANGGSSNAYTALDHTNYFFSLKPDAMAEGIDRFAHFFISPIISEKYSLREKTAVHSEYQSQLKEDGWRGYMVGKQALNPKHPGSKFTIGSLETLDGDIQEDLIAFFETEYSADQMALAVISNQDLDSLEALVTPLFSQIKNKDIGSAYPNIDMYTPAELPATLEFQAQKAGANVTYLFPMPSTLGDYRQKSEAYFSNLFGHEGAGSLHKLLRQYGWIENLGASVSELDRNMSGLYISMDLTPAGRDKVSEITDLIFQYTDLLVSNEPQAWLYQEQAKVAEIGFRFQEKSNPLGLVYQLTPRMDKYPPSDLLVAPYLMEGFNPAKVKELLSYVRADNVLVQFSAPDVQGESLEPWFKVPYTLTRGPVERTQVATNALHLPDPNPYLPDNLELAENDAKPIAPYAQEPGLELWLDTETGFGSPRAQLRLQLGVASGLTTPKDRSMAFLYRLLVNDALAELTYPAYLAGLGYSISVPNSGFDVSISGYQDKQAVLLSKVLDALLNTPLRAERFELLKAQLIKDWRNAAKDRPYSQAFSALTDTLHSNRWPSSVMADTVEDITLADLAAWRKTMLASLDVRGILVGNVTNKEADALVARLKADLPLAKLGFAKAHADDVVGTVRKEIDVEHDDASMVLHVQDADDSLTSRAKSSLAAQLLHPAYFFELRTEQQRGYVVSVSNRPVAGRGGLSFIVQSPNTSSAQLEGATLEFVESFNDSWPEVTEDEFNQQKNGLINRLTEKPKNLSEKSQRYWNDFVDDIYTFDRREQIADIVANLTREEMAAFFLDVQEKLASNRLLIFTRGKFEGIPERGRLLSQTDPISSAKESS